LFAYNQTQCFEIVHRRSNRSSSSVSGTDSRQVQESPQEAAPTSSTHQVPHIIGFKKFHGVAENPTKVLVGTIEEYVRKHHGMPTGTLLGSITKKSNCKKIILVITIFRGLVFLCP